jgi:hypothetical protein
MGRQASYRVSNTLGRKRFSREGDADPRLIASVDFGSSFLLLADCCKLKKSLVQPRFNRRG